MSLKLCFLHLEFVRAFRLLSSMFRFIPPLFVLAPHDLNLAKFRLACRAGGLANSSAIHERAREARERARSLRKGSKNTSVHNHSFNTNPFLRPLERLEKYVPNVSLAVRTPGVIRSKFFGSRSNSWHHPLKSFRSPLERLASSV